MKGLMFQTAMVQKVYVTDHLTLPVSPVMGTVQAGSTWVFRHHIPEEFSLSPLLQVGATLQL